MEAQIPKHFMRFGIHSERGFFFEPFRDCYDGVALNGNLVAYSLKGVCSFISHLLTDKPYFIDPITHAFGHHPQYIARRYESGRPIPKAAIKALSDEFGSPAADFIGKRGLRPEDFSSPETGKRFTARVLEFQKNIIEKGLEGDAKYIKATSRTPSFLIAPYFYMPSNSVEEWLDLNINFIEYSVDTEDELPIFAEVLVSYEAFLDPEVREKLLYSYGRCKAKGILLWVESLSESSASLGSLRNYREFVSKLEKTQKTIVVMYGGYFSIVLRKFGVHAVCHGPGYGEEREVTPVGGGIPRPKFYFPRMHLRLPHREVAYALNDADIDSAKDYYEKVCKCPICRDEVIKDDFTNFAIYGESESGIRKDGIAFEYPTTKAKALSTAHYVYSKKAEFDFVDGNGMLEIIRNLEESREFCSRLFGANEAAHLGAWREAMTE